MYQILNLAKDEGLIVNINRNGANSRTVITVTRSENFSWRVHELMEEQTFFDIITNIHDRIKLIYDDINYLSYVKDFGWKRVDGLTLRTPDTLHPDLIGRAILGYCFAIRC